MFETVELGNAITKDDYKQQLADLRASLLEVQFQLSHTNIPVIIIISGIDGAGRGETVNALSEWLDMRGIETISLDTPTDEEGERPYYWRFWRNLPARGRMTIFFGGWYAEPIQGFAYGDLDENELEARLTQIRRFEDLLVHDHALILKFWLHFSKDEQRKRLKKLEGDPNTHRVVTNHDWKNSKLYDKFIKAATYVIQRTSSGTAPWLLVEATDWRYRNLTVARILLANLNEHIEKHTPNVLSKVVQKPALPVAEQVLPPSGAGVENLLVLPPQLVTRTVLDSVDLSQRLRGKAYSQELAVYQGKLHRLTLAASQQKRSTVIVFEGWDAAGKGGSIRRLTQAMDARLYRVISTAAPTDEERAHHYLWRFWRHIPRAGRVTIYDRSWYGRVLVERVEGFAKVDEWERAYLEINHFEEQLFRHGTVVLKFWLHISAEEQLQRFHEREAVAYKRHKITPEDWRNRSKWNDYLLAVNDMVARTSTDFARWSLIAANDKRYARLEVLKVVCERLEQALAEE